MVGFLMVGPVGGFLIGECDWLIYWLFDWCTKMECHVWEIVLFFTDQQICLMVPVCSYLMGQWLISWL